MARLTLTPLAENRTLLTLPNGIEVFFSYRTPVAAFVPGTGYVRTGQYWSRTTTRHIGQYLRDHAPQDAPVTTVDQTVLDALVTLA